MTAFDCLMQISEPIINGHLVNAFREHVNVGFFLGSTLRDPARILEGTGRHMRHVKLLPGGSINQGAIRELIAQAFADLTDRLATQ